MTLQGPSVASISEPDIQVVHCTGITHFVYALGALEAARVAPEACRVHLYYAEQSNTDLKETAFQLAVALGMKVQAVIPPPSPGASVLLWSLPLRHARDTVFWYARGNPMQTYALFYLRRQRPLVYEYYDGFRSPIVAQQVQQAPLPAWNKRDLQRWLQRWAEQKILQPDQYYMPDDGLWQRYAPQHAQRRTTYIPLAVVRQKIHQVGTVLDQLGGQAGLAAPAPGLVLATGMFSERAVRQLRLADELRMYEDIVRTLRAAAPATSMLIKPHPRSSDEKRARLAAIAAHYGATIEQRQQLLEFIIEQSGRRPVVVIAPPSTVLLNTRWFGYGAAYCIDQPFIMSYLGPQYLQTYHLYEHDHRFMTMSGVTMIQSLAQLAELLDAHQF